MATNKKTYYMVGLIEDNKNLGIFEAFAESKESWYQVILRFEPRANRWVDTSERPVTVVMSKLTDAERKLLEPCKKVIDLNVPNYNKNAPGFQKYLDDIIAKNNAAPDSERLSKQDIIKLLNEKFSLDKYCTVDDF